MGDHELLEGETFTFEQLLRQRAVDPDHAALLAYPRTRCGVGDSSRSLALR